MDATHATHDLIIRHRRIAWAVARRWHRRAEHLPIDELRSDAELGLVKAARSYRPDSIGASFVTWAWRCCTNELKTRWLARSSTNSI